MSSGSTLRTATSFPGRASPATKRLAQILKQSLQGLHDGLQDNHRILYGFPTWIGDDVRVRQQNPFSADGKTSSRTVVRIPEHLSLLLLRGR